MIDRNCRKVAPERIDQTAFQCTGAGEQRNGRGIAGIRRGAGLGPKAAGFAHHAPPFGIAVDRGAPADAARLHITRQDEAVLSIEDGDEPKYEAQGRIAARGDQAGSDCSRDHSHCGREITERAILPEAEGLAVAVEQVRKGFQLLPLALVMRVSELARISPFAGGFQFDEARQRTSDGDGIVRPRPQGRKGAFPDKCAPTGLLARGYSKAGDQFLERRADVVFRGPCDCRVGKLGLGGRTVLGHDLVKHKLPRHVFLQP